MAGKIASRLVIGLFAAACVAPVVVTVLFSLMSRAEMAAPAHLLPHGVSLYQFEQVLLRIPRYLRWFWNSCGYTLATLGIALPVCLLAAFGFAKFTFPCKDVLFFAYIIIMLMPFQATQVPQYITLKTFNLLDNPVAVILPNAFGAFGVFLLTQFIKGISDEFIEAAQIDGVSVLQVFIHIIVPLSKPAAAALSILLFVESWSMIEQPLLFLNNALLYPLSLYLGNISLSLYAAGVLFLVPPTLVYIYGHRHLAEGIALGSVK